MAREILFRGKAKKNGEWVYGDLCYSRSGKPFIRYWHGAPGKEVYRAEEVEQNSVEMYTGLDDQYGKRIFEGDIVNYHGSHHQVVFENRYGCAYFGIVVSEIETWGFGHLAPCDRMIVVGNIHDNIEMLETENGQNKN